MLVWIFVLSEGGEAMLCLRPLLVYLYNLYSEVGCCGSLANTSACILLVMCYESRYQLKLGKTCNV